jgi:hypothetical protein
LEIQIFCYKSKKNMAGKFHHSKRHLKPSKHLFVKQPITDHRSGFTQNTDSSFDKKTFQAVERAPPIEYPRIADKGSAHLSERKKAISLLVYRFNLAFTVTRVPCSRERE